MLLFYDFSARFKCIRNLFIKVNPVCYYNNLTLFKSVRVNVIKFDRHFSVDEQDKSLKAKLKQDEVLSGVLNWCIEGLQDYRKQGLNPPPCIIDANEEYQGYSDLLKQFLDDCFIESEKSTKLNDVYALYCKWRKVKGVYAEPKQALNERLQNRGMTATIHGIRSILKGLEIKATLAFQPNGHNLCKLYVNPLYRGFTYNLHVFCTKCILIGRGDKSVLYIVSDDS